MTVLPAPSLQIVSVARRLGADVGPDVYWFYGQLHDIAQVRSDRGEVAEMASMLSLTQAARVIFDAHIELEPTQQTNPLKTCQAAVTRWVVKVMHEFERDLVRSQLIEEQQHGELGS